MIDFNSSASLSGRLQELFDQALEAERDVTPPRAYLGASRLGAACERLLQYEYVKAPVDHGKGFSGRLLRIFERGHRTEDMVIRWLRMAGFTLKTEDANCHQFGFSVAGGRLRGHVDGVLLAGPEGFAYPSLWENKCLGAKSWRDVEKHKLVGAFRVIARRELDRVAGVAKIDEVDAFHHTARGDVEARDHSCDPHQALPDAATACSMVNFCS